MLVVEGTPLVSAHKTHSWLSQVGFCTAAIFICYADRSNVSTAIIEMSKRYDWDQARAVVVAVVFDMTTSIYHINYIFFTFATTWSF